MTLLFGSMICAEWRSDVIFIDENDEGPGVRLRKSEGDEGVGLISPEADRGGLNACP